MLALWNNLTQAMLMQQAFSTTTRQSSFSRRWLCVQWLLQEYSQQVIKRFCITSFGTNTNQVVPQTYPPAYLEYLPTCLPTCLLKVLTNVSTNLPTLPTYLCSYLPTNLLTNLPACQRTYFLVLTCQPTFLPTSYLPLCFRPTCLPTYLHSYLLNQRLCD